MEIYGAEISKNAHLKDVSTRGYRAACRMSLILSGWERKCRRENFAWGKARLGCISWKEWGIRGAESRGNCNGIWHWFLLCRSCDRYVFNRQSVVAPSVVCFFVIFFRENTLQIDSDYGTLEDRVMIKK